MKTILLLLLMIPICLHAQEPVKSEKNHFVSPEGKLYWQGAKPIYIFVSDNPEGTNILRLNSKSTPKYANPMYLDTEGINYIRSKWAVDKETKKTVLPKREIMYEMYKDGVSPKSFSKFTSVPSYHSGTVQYYGKGLSVHLNSADAVSGVKNVYYSVNEEEYKIYSENISFEGDKATTLRYFAQDNVGNVETTHLKSFTVDISPPASTHEIVGIVYNGNIIAPSTKFKLTSKDELSGVKRTYYKYDDGTERIYPAYPVGVKQLNDGDHSISYHSIDRVKNDEDERDFKFYLDKIAPVVKVEVQGDQYETNSRMYVSSRTKINMTATDNKAGVESIQYNLDRKGYVAFGSPFIIPPVAGIHNVIYYGIDNVKNKNAAKSVASTIGNRQIYMDDRAPTTGISYSKSQFFTRDTLFISSKTNVILKSIDNASGVDRIEYSIGDGSMTTYSSSFNVSNDGHQTIKFKATDRVNNVEQEKESEVFVDNTPPEIYHNFSIKSIGTKKKDGETLDIYPNYTRLYLGATDIHCGTDKITYSLNGSDFLDYSSPYTLDISEVKKFGKNKAYNAVIRATDKLGNQSEKVINFFVGE